jgi:N-ethylmaleimide reductase
MIKPEPHIIKGLAMAVRQHPEVLAWMEGVLAHEMKREFGGPVVMNGYGRDVAAAERDIERGVADAVAFGKLAISNPDLPERIARGAEPAPWDESTFYVGGAKGYVE